MPPLSQEEVESVRAGLRPFLDIEWFAYDSVGHLAAFVTAGFAAVPLCAFDREMSFSEVYTCIDALGRSSEIEPVDKLQGKNPSFTKFASKGLFVYDWNHAMGGYHSKLPYRLMTRPLSPMVVARTGLQNSIPRLPLVFSVSTAIVIEEFFRELNV